MERTEQDESLARALVEALEKVRNDAPKEDGYDRDKVRVRAMEFSQKYVTLVRSATAAEFTKSA